MRRKAKNIKVGKWNFDKLNDRSSQVYTIGRLNTGLASDTMVFMDTKSMNLLNVIYKLKRKSTKSIRFRGLK